MHKFSRKFAGVAFGLMLFCGLATAESVALNPAHPDRYVVVRGDTLWDISARFLRDPWRWPDVWQVNPKIENPHLIYPGDILQLTYVDGQPRIGLIRGQRDYKLSPGVRRTPLDTSIPTIPIDAISPFLSKPYVMEKEELRRAPYVVEFVDEHILGGLGNGIYVRAIQQSEPIDFEVVRPGGPYKDPDTGDILGYEALYVGDATLRSTGDPATLLLERTEIETIIGDRLLPVEDEIALTDFQPRAPARPIEGRIISVLNGVTQIGQYQVVVLSKGADDGLVPGDVLRIFTAGEVVRDVVSPQPGATVRLPEEEAGFLMVFRTFSRVSFALIMYANRALHVLDVVRHPDL